MLCPIVNVNLRLGPFFFMNSVWGLLAILRLRVRPGRDGCQSTFWDCFGGRICHHVENAFPKAVPQCTLTTSRPGLPGNLKGANNVLDNFVQEN